MKKSEMLQQLIKHYGNGKKVNFAQLLGIPAQNVSTWLSRGTFNHELIYSKCPNLSPHWLLTGEGEMLLSGNKPNTQDNNMIQNKHIVYHTQHPDIIEPTPTVDGVSTVVEELPIVPSDLVKQPDIDIYKVVTTNRDIPRQPVVKQFPPATLFYRITSKSMEPYICSGDKLVLDAYPRGHEQIIPGDPYVVDTRPNGFVTRLLYNHPDGYIARTFTDSGRYAEFIIPFSDIIRIYRIVGLLRTNVQ